jgi:hypothetical protein
MKISMMSREYQEQICVENVAKILYHLSKFKSLQASFVYRQARHSWLSGGIHPHIESSVLQEALRLLGVPFTVERCSYRGRSYRSRVIVHDVPKLREVLKQLEKDGRLYRVLKKAYKSTTCRLFGRE